MQVITGIKELDEKLAELSKSKVRSVTRKAVTKGARVIAKSQKKLVPPRYKHVKTIIGSRYSKDKSETEPTAKAGFGVGKKGKTAEKLRQGGKHRRKEGAKNRGVGLSLNNIHWAVLGTENREQKSGHKTGKMPAILEDIIPRGSLNSAHEVGAVIQKSLTESIAKEFKK